MMLEEKQPFIKRGWEESRTQEFTIQDEILIDSEKKLQEILAQLKRDPTGMVSDFDLHTINSTGPIPRPPSLSQSSRSKRLKNNCSTHVPAPFNHSCAKVIGDSSTKPEDSSDSTPKDRHENEPVIDFPVVSVSRDSMLEIKPKHLLGNGRVHVDSRAESNACKAVLSELPGRPGIVLLGHLLVGRRPLRPGPTTAYMGRASSDPRPESRRLGRRLLEEGPSRRM